MISFIHSLFALLFRGAFLLLMLLIFLLICFNFLFFKIFLPAFLPCLFLKNLACVLLVGVVTCMPWWFVPCWLVVRGWLPACLEPCVPCWLVGVPGRFVVGGYLHALNLVCLAGWCAWLVVVTCMP